jgi:hypothetical protein
MDLLKPALVPVPRVASALLTSVARQFAAPALEALASEF